MNKNLLSLKDLSKDDILSIIEFSNNFISKDGSFIKEDLFPDKTIANLFFEPSTRTKCSFEIAAKNLGCSVIDFNVDGSSVAKGESIYHTVDALSLMGVDLCVVRHSDSIINNLANYMPDVIFINAGEGTISHPTHALIDLMTINQLKGSLDNLNITIVGDLDHSRVVRSFIDGISNFQLDSLVFSGHPEMCKDYMNNSIGIYEPDLDKALLDADVIMALRIQHERFNSNIKLDLEEYKSLYQLTTERISIARGDVIVMHPGPVNLDIEISEAAYSLDSSIIRNQIANSVPMRMAVLARFLSQ